MCIIQEQNNVENTNTFHKEINALLTGKIPNNWKSKRNHCPTANLLKQK